jgi:DNA-binding response OmpR family regulator
MSYLQQATAPNHRALVVGAPPLATSRMREALVEQGFRVDASADPDAALRLAGAFDVIVLDLGVPEADPIEVCRRLRSATNAYIVAVGEQEPELQLVLSLSVGADDFIPRPVRNAELVARVRAMLRRPREVAAAQDVVRVADLEIDARAREVHVAGRQVDLSTLEFDLLETLARNPKLTLSREQLLRQVWGTDWYGDDHVIDVHVSNLRRKLGDDAHAPRYIRTVRGFGFRIGEGARTSDRPAA